MLKEGIVKSFNAKRGYGFISVIDENKDIIAHYSVIQGKFFKVLKPNQKVFISYEKNDKGLRATKVVAMKCKKKKN